MSHSCSTGSLGSIIFDVLEGAASRPAPWPGAGSIRALGEAGGGCFWNVLLLFSSLPSIGWWPAVRAEAATLDGTWGRISTPGCADILSLLCSVDDAVGIGCPPLLLPLLLTRCRSRCGAPPPEGPGGGASLGRASLDTSCPIFLASSGCGFGFCCCCCC